MTRARKTVAVDFDGVLHPYTDGWQGMIPADEPPDPRCYPFLRALDAAGFSLVVHSSRAATPEGRAGIEFWLWDNGLRDLFVEITHLKVSAIAYVDDRAVHFAGDWDAAELAVHALAQKGAGPEWH